MNLDAIKAYADAGALVMSVAYYQEKPVVFHSYVDGKNRARFFHSCSTFRSEKDQASVIGRANKRLHWEDWMYFKSHGYSIYDWVDILSFFLSLKYLFLYY